MRLFLRLLDVIVLSEQPLTHLNINILTPNYLITHQTVIPTPS